MLIARPFWVLTVKPCSVASLFSKEIAVDALVEMIVPAREPVAVMSTSLPMLRFSDQVPETHHCRVGKRIFRWQMARD